MMTVVDPGGSPIPIYNRDGLTVANVTANGTTAGSGTAITRYSGWTVALVATSTGNQAVVLPSDAEIGDLVEVYSTLNNGAQAIVFPPSGQSFLAGFSSHSALPGDGALFRYVATDTWACISSANN